MFGIGYQNASGKNCVPIGLIEKSPLLLSTGSAYVTVTDVDAFGATGDGNVISTRCRSPLVSVPGRNVAAAPATATDFTLAFAFRRTVSVRPVLPPTFVAFNEATTFSTRSACCTFALTSYKVTCQMTGAAVCASTRAQTHNNRSKERSVFIIEEKLCGLPGPQASRLPGSGRSYWRIHAGETPAVPGSTASILANQLMNVADHEKQRL